MRQLADAASVDAATIHRLEHGQFKKPSPKMLLGLARVLQVPIEDLYVLAGYTAPEGLPELAPYLRAKYDLPEGAADELEAYLSMLKNKYGPAKKRSRSKKPKK